jgi:hypothetical protein
MTTPSDTTTSDDSTTGTTSRRGFLSAAVAVGAIAGTGAVSAGALQSKPSASVTFNDQKTGGKMVMVESVMMSKGGFVAIHDSSLLDGNVLGSVIGVSEKLDAGTHENVEITLFDVPGGDYDMSMLMENQTLIAMPHLDTNGNGTYDFLTSGGKKDGPYTKNEKAVVDRGKITVKEGMMNGGKDGKDEKDGGKMKKPSASVSFNDQKTGGNTVTVQSITMSKSGFAAIHDSSLLDGKVLESVIGVSKKLEAGTHEDVDVMLFEGVPGADFDQKVLKEDQPLIAMPHLDSNDNATYDFITSGGKKDKPYTEGGKAVIDKAMITVKEEMMEEEEKGEKEMDEEEKKKATASVMFNDQETDGNSVMVESVSMTKGGFVAIHDSSLLDGNVLGSVIGVSEKLDAGTHENVEVMLFEGVPGGDYDQEVLKEDQKLIAMPHLDTNDNATYDFITSDGEKDGPYTEGGKAVVDSGCVTVCE